MPPLILSTNLIKWKSKIDYPQDSIWYRFDWEPEVIATALCSTANGESHKVLYTHSKKLWNNPRDISHPGNCASVLKSHNHHPEQHQIQQNKNQTSWTHLHSSFELINTRNKNIKTQIHPACSFCLATPGTKRKTHHQIDKPNTCD